MRRSAMLIAMLLIAAPEPAEAARQCNVRNFSIDFGNYVPGLGMAVHAVGSLQLLCSGRPAAGQPDFVLITIGGGLTGNPADRRLGGLPDGLPYQLFKDAAYSQIWGDDTGGTTSLRVDLSGNQRRIRLTIPVYARIEGTEDPLPGPYADNLLVETSF